MHPAGEIGQREIGRVERSQGALAIGSCLTDAPHVMLRVGDHRSSQQDGERCEVESITGDEIAFSRRGYGDAYIALAEALGFVDPSGDAFEIALVQPECGTI